MPAIKINLKVPTNREYKSLPWSMREAKKFEITKATKDGLLEHPLPAEPRPLVSIMIGSNAYPENLYISPVIAVLRRLGWIAEDATIVLATMEPSASVYIYID